MTTSSSPPPASVMTKDVKSADDKKKLLAEFSEWALTKKISKEQASNEYGWKRENDLLTDQDRLQRYLNAAQWDIAAGKKKLCAALNRIRAFDPDAPTSPEPLRAQNESRPLPVKKHSAPSKPEKPVSKSEKVKAEPQSPITRPAASAPSSPYSKSVPATPQPRRGSDAGLAHPTPQRSNSSPGIAVSQASGRIYLTPPQQTYSRPATSPRPSTADSSTSSQRGKAKSHLDSNQPADNTEEGLIMKTKKSKSMSNFPSSASVRSEDTREVSGLAGLLALKKLEEERSRNSNKRPRPEDDNNNDGRNQDRSSRESSRLAAHRDKLRRISVDRPNPPYELAFSPRSPFNPRAAQGRGPWASPHTPLTANTLRQLEREYQKRHEDPRSSNIPHFATPRVPPSSAHRRHASASGPNFGPGPQPLTPRPGVGRFPYYPFSPIPGLPPRAMPPPSASAAADGKAVAIRALFNIAEGVRELAKWAAMQ